MCLERLTQLKCGHYEIYQVDKDNCKHGLHKKCPNFIQLVIRQDKKRSCMRCNAIRNVHLGFASPSLMNMK